jgi:hypothetical protein
LLPCNINIFTIMSQSTLNIATLGFQQRILNTS